MSQGNLDDLIIGNGSSGAKKSKNSVVMIALIVIIIFVAIMLIKSIMGTSPEETKVKVPDANQTEKSEPENKEESLENELEKIKNDISLEDSEPPTVSAPSKSNESENETKEDSEDIQAPKVENLDTTDSDEATTTIKKPEVSTEKTAPKAEEAVKSPETDKRPTSKPEISKPKPKVPLEIKTQEIYNPNKPKSTKAPVAKPSSRPSRVSNNSPKGYYVQIGSFSKKPTQSYIDNISSFGLDCTVVNINDTYRVRVGPYETYEMAKEKLPIVRAKIVPDAFIVNNK